MRRVASPPSSTRRLAPEPSGQVSICSVHHQYSSRVSPCRPTIAPHAEHVMRWGFDRHQARCTYCQKKLHDQQLMSRNC